VKNKANYLKGLKNRYLHLKEYEDIYIKGISKYSYETLAEHVFDSRYQVVYIKAVLECVKKKYFVYEDVLNETSLSERSVKRYIKHLQKIKWIIEERNPLDKRAKIFKMRIPEDIKILLDKTFSW
jgi:hypothetical protein